MQEFVYRPCSGKRQEYQGFYEADADSAVKFF